MEVKIIECPRDAMQGLSKIISTDTKVNYLNALLEVGFDTLDCGSFVNAKVIPQMADTSEVLKRLKMTETKLSVIVANYRGAQSAVEFEEITYLGFPFSVSESFQIRNTNSSMETSLNSVEAMVDLCEKNGKKFITYISMGFGNLSNEPWSPKLVVNWIKKLKQRGVNYFSLSDTVGVSNPETITSLISHINSECPGLNFGCHFHTKPDEWEEKIKSALDAGCMRFDGAIKGFGGCPMADDKLVGNMPTENMVLYFEEKGVNLGIDKQKFNDAMIMAAQVFS